LALVDCEGRYALPMSRRARAAGAIDATGSRNEALDAFLERKLDEGFEIEARRDTHAIIVGRDRRTFLRRRRRYVVSVDEHGDEVTMVEAEPKRS